MTTQTISFIGASQSGKTEYINRIAKDFGTKTKNTITFNTNIGDVSFKIIESTQHSAKTDALIVFFNPFDRKSLDFADSQIQVASENFPNLPIVLCGTMADKGGNYCFACMKTFKRLTKLPNVVGFMVSSKSGYNIGKPILHIIKTLSNKDNITLVDKILQYWEQTKTSLLLLKAKLD